MTKRLIVNADDFGLCKEMATGIIKAYSEGIVRSTSVSVNGGYFNEGLKLLKDSGIDAGIHLTFTGGERPVSGGIDGLVDERGLFLKSYREAIPRIVTGRFDKKALRRELFEQISILKDSGINISHADSHQHLHLLPNVADLVIDLARQFNIKWVRITRSGGSDIKSIAMNFLAGFLKSKLKRHGLSFTDGFTGFEYSGRMDERAISSLLNNIPDGTTELMVHPGYDASKEYGWGYAWEDELMAVTSETIKALIKKNGIALTDFRG